MIIGLPLWFRFWFRFWFRVGVGVGFGHHVCVHGISGHGVSVYGVAGCVGLSCRVGVVWLAGLGVVLVFHQ